MREEVLQARGFCPSTAPETRSSGLCQKLPVDPSSLPCASGGAPATQQIPPQRTPDYRPNLIRWNSSRYDAFSAPPASLPTGTTT